MSDHFYFFFVSSLVFVFGLFFRDWFLGSFFPDSLEKVYMARRDHNQPANQLVLAGFGRFVVVVVVLSFLYCFYPFVGTSIHFSVNTSLNG